MTTGRFLPSRLSKAVPRELGTSTGMTAVQSLSFAQHKSEQNKIAIAKAGYHRGGGILPFVLYGAFGGSRCVRTYAGKWQNFTISGCSFLGGCDILCSVQTNRNLKGENSCIR